MCRMLMNGDIDATVTSAATRAVLRSPVSHHTVRWMSTGMSTAIAAKRISTPSSESNRYTPPRR